MGFNPVRHKGGWREVIEDKSLRGMHIFRRFGGVTEFSFASCWSRTVH